MREDMKFLIKKTIDRLGRIVIPKNLREYYEIQLGDELALIPTDEGILLINPNEKKPRDKKE